MKFFWLQTTPGIGCVLPMPRVSILSLATPLEPGSRAQHSHDVPTVSGCRQVPIGSVWPVPGQFELRHTAQLADDLAVIAAMPSGFRTALSKSNNALAASVIFCPEQAAGWRCRRGRRGRRYNGRRRCRLRHQIGVAFDDGHRRRPISGTPAQSVVNAGLAAIGPASPDIGIRLAVTEQCVAAILRIGLAERCGTQHGGSCAGHDGRNQTKFVHFHPFG